MINLSMVQALDLWTDLEAALRGENGYGGDVAEIYAYRCGTRSPAAIVLPNSEIGAKEKRADCLRAAASLVALCKHFEEKRDALIRIQRVGRKEMWIGAWPRGELFDHRVHLRVVPRAPKRRSP